MEGILLGWYLFLLDIADIEVWGFLCKTTIGFVSQAVFIILYVF